MSSALSSVKLQPWQSHWALRRDFLRLAPYSGWLRSCRTARSDKIGSVSSLTDSKKFLHKKRREKEMSSFNSHSTFSELEQLSVKMNASPQNYKESRIKKTLRSRFVLARGAGRLHSTTVCWPNAGYIYNFWVNFLFLVIENQNKLLFSAVWCIIGCSMSLAYNCHLFHVPRKIPFLLIEFRILFLFLYYFDGKKIHSEVCCTA